MFKSWRILVFMLIAAGVLCLVVVPSKNTDLPTVAKRNVFDALSIWVGGIGFVLALTFGFLLIRVGFNIKPQGE